MMNNFDIEKFLDEIYRKNYGKKLFLFVMGMLISALSFNLFYKPYNVIPTGSSGFALLISNFIDIDVSIIIWIVSLILLLLGLIFFGFEYASKMLAVTILYPFFVTSTTLITRFIDLEDTSLFLIMVFGGGMMGLSSGLIRRSGFNPGGFAVLFDLFQKYFYISIGNATLVINAIMIVASGFIFGFSNAVYALVSLLVSSYIVDRVVIGISSNKVFYIITSKPLEVRDYIIDKLHYSVTLVNARGGYTNKKKKMLMCVVPTIEYINLKKLISEIDPKVFFLIVDAYESSVKKNCKNM